MLSVENEDLAEKWCNKNILWMQTKKVIEEIQEHFYIAISMETTVYKRSLTVLAISFLSSSKKLQKIFATPILIMKRS